MSGRQWSTDSHGIFQLENLEGRVLLSVTDPVGWWRFDDAAGLQAVDSSGNGNTASVLNGATWAGGVVNGSINLNGSNQLAVAGDSNSLDVSGQITLSAWIKPSKKDTQYIIKKARYDATDGYELSLSSSGKVFVRFNQKSSDNAFRVDSTTSYPSNGSTWMHVAATYDGATIKLYINGNLNASKNASLTIGTNSVGLGLGAEDSGVAPFKGQLDDVRIYNHVLTDAEVKTLSDLPPVVNAGADQSITLPNVAQLNGSISDDGLPNPPAAVSGTWSQVDGPGTVSFGDANALQTSATFSAAGTYVLRLMGDDGFWTAQDDLTVVVQPPSGSNAAPVVDAGSDQTITLPDSAALLGSVSDDGLPASGTLSSNWSVSSGPGTVTFGDASAPQTSADFSLAGTYVLKLTANDGELSAFDEVTVTVNPVPPTNQAPGVDAGADQIVTLPDGVQLSGSVTDDNLPNPPASVTTTWSKVSGPGSVTFGSPNALQTSATFSTAGTYVLRLTADDGELIGSDDLSVQVNPQDNTGPVGWWKLDDGSGNTAVDSSGSGNNGTLVNNPTWGGGMVGGGMNFSGANQRISIPDSNSLDLSGQITISAWIKPGEQDTQYLVKKARNGTVNGYELSLSSNGKVFVRFNEASSGNTYRLDSSTSYPTDGNTWMHVAATYDGTTIKLYINGVLDASVNKTLTIATNSIPLSLGSDDDYSAPMKGSLDDVRIYGRALTATEIQSLTSNVNYAPVVSAGGNQSAGVGQAITLNGTVSDDGLPNPPSAVNVLWSKVSGPGSVVFGNAGSPVTTATFSAAGTYIVRLTASDGELVSSSDATITVGDQNFSIQPLQTLNVSADTGEKPQSKVWQYNQTWWCVMPNSNGTWIWRLDGTKWKTVLKLSNLTNTHSDTKVVGNVTHILMYHGSAKDSVSQGDQSGYGAQLVSVQYVAGAPGKYKLWTVRPGVVDVPLTQGVETASFDIDSTGRMWMVSDTNNSIEVRYADFPYGVWSAPITLATGLTTDDIGSIIAMPNGRIGVLWSNQNTQLFGFRTHVDGTDPGTWTADEMPASGSALNVGDGFADDHLHMAVSSDGTLYAAVKTSYDTDGYPKMGLLVRRPDGTWDPFYAVDNDGTRAVVTISESTNTLLYMYTETEISGVIYYRTSPLGNIAFSPRQVLIGDGHNNVTTAKANFSDQIVVLAGTDDSTKMDSVKISFAAPIGGLMAYSAPSAGGTFSSTLIDSGSGANSLLSDATVPDALDVLITTNRKKGGRA